MTQEQYKLEMKDLIDNWQQRNGTVKTVQHKQEVELLIDHTQNFICDGVVCPEKWFSQSIRPLYLLKEAYGEGSWDLIADHLCKSGQISQMWRRVSKWTSGLLGTTENTLMPYGNWGDVDHYGNEYLQKIAVVNVKKSGGKSSSNMDEIRAYAQFDREELLRELELCDPTVIVCGYTASVMDIIFKTSVRKDRNENLFYHIQLNGHDVLVLDYWHPANQYYKDGKPVADKLKTIRFEKSRQKYKVEHDDTLRLFYMAERKLKGQVVDGKLPVAAWRAEKARLETEYRDLQTELTPLYADVKKLWGIHYNIYEVQHEQERQNAAVRQKKQEIEH